MHGHFPSRTVPKLDVFAFPKYFVSVNGGVGSPGRGSSEWVMTHMLLSQQPVVGLGAESE